MVENDYPHHPYQSISQGEGSISPLIPLPSESKEITEKTAGFGIRSLAYAIDRIILSIIGIGFLVAGVLAIKTGSYLQTGISSLRNLTSAIILAYAAMLLIEIAYYTYFHGRTGQTVGKMICGIKVVNIQGENISYKRALGRWVGYVISSLILYLGFLWIAFDRNHQGWHDKLVKTYVIKV